jgi:hypothetical protein
MPERIQRKRIADWRLAEQSTNPAGVKYVGRGVGSIYGNPYAYLTRYGLARVPAIDGSPWEYEGRISADGIRHDYCHPDGSWTEHTVRYMTREECVALHRRALLTPTPQLRLWVRKWNRHLTVEDVRRDLAGKDLACWCALDVACHADTYLEVANPTRASTKPFSVGGVR